MTAKLGFNTEDDIMQAYNLPTHNEKYYVECEKIRKMKKSAKSEGWNSEEKDT